MLDKLIGKQLHIWAVDTSLFPILAICRPSLTLCSPYRNL